MKLAEAYPGFQAEKAEVVAISIDGIPDAAQMATLTGALFPVLADPVGKVVRRYGFYDLHGDKVAAPATIIIGQEGAVLWRNVGQSITDRPTAEQILAVLKDLE